MLTTAKRALFSSFVDYADLSPFSSMDMADAVAQYRSTRASTHGWILGRFLCPASRLEELAGVLVARLPIGEVPWPVSVVLDGEPSSAAVAARNFDAEMDPAATVALVEASLPTSSCVLDDPARAADEMAPIISTALSVSPSSLSFFEFVFTSQWRSGIPAALGALALHRNRERRPIGIKLRCGGLDRDNFPTAEQLATLIEAARVADVPIKVTDGLRRPIRHLDDELGAMRHGFLNLLVAVAFCDAGLARDVVLAVLEETDELAFSVGLTALRWRDHRVATRSIEQLRAVRLISCGVDDFDQSISALAAMGLLGD